MILKSRRVLLDTGADVRWGAGAAQPASVRVHNGQIVAVGSYHEEITDSEGGLDLGDLVLMPGLVDTHVHVNEPGRTEWEGFASATRAAAAGGVTTIIDMPLNSLPPTVSVPALAEKKAAAAGKCHVDVGFWGGAVPDNGPWLRPLHDAGVFGFKAFLIDSGVPEFPPLSLAELDTALSTVDALFVVHAEDPATVRPAISSAHYRDFVASRPPQAETRAVAAAIDAARRTGARMHILHLSAAEALDVLAQAQAEGVRVTAETCPHYLTLVDEQIPDGATQFKCCPPIRDAANQDLLWTGLADGTLHCVVSDHSPCTPELKWPAGSGSQARQTWADIGDFAAAWGGIASIQLGLSVVWTEARRRGVPLHDVVTWMSRRPADLVGLANKGRIKVGADADLVAFDPDATWTVDPAALHHRNPVTAYAGRTLTGVVRHTWLRGVEVDGVHPRGRLLERGAA